MNEHAFKINYIILNLYESEEIVCSSIDNIVKDDAVNFSTECLNSINSPGIPTYFGT